MAVHPNYAPEQASPAAVRSSRRVPSSKVIDDPKRSFILSSDRLSVSEMPDPPRWLLTIFFRPVRLFLACFVLAVFSFRMMMHIERHNPNSHFFNPTEETFAANYTESRKKQARSWIDFQDVAIQNGRAKVPLYKPVSTGGELAVVFLAVQRPNEQYLDASVGSFLAELKPEQREKMHITVSLGEEDATHQPFFSTAWLHTLVDEIVVRQEPKTPYLPPSLLAQKEHPTAKITTITMPLTTLANKDINTNSWHQKSTVDYSVALEVCQKHPSSYCLVIEDDVVFATRWYDRFDFALRSADARMHTDERRWGYMRLFYAEKYFGWETEEVQTLVFSCATVLACVALLLMVFGRLPARYAMLAGIRSRGDLLHSHRDDVAFEERKPSRLRGQKSGLARERVARVRLPLASQLLILVMTVFFCVLFILSGRNHVYKVPNGVSIMNERGCCTQAIVYAPDVIKPIMDHLRQFVGVRPYDILINRWLVWNNRNKLAIHPPLVQHIGVASTRSMVDETYLRSTPLWSFAFEKYSAKLAK